MLSVNPIIVVLVIDDWQIRIDFIVVTLVVVPCGHLSLRLRGVLLISAETIIEGVQVERVAGQAVNHLGHARLKVPNTVTKALFHRLLRNRVNLGVNLHRKQVLVAGEIVLDELWEAMVVGKDKNELTTKNMCRLLLLNASESTSHHCDNHIQDDEQSDKRVDDEDEPKHEDVVRVFHKTASHFKVSQG